MLDRLDPRALARALLGPRPRGRRRPGGPPSASTRDYRARRAAGQAKALARERLRAVAVDGKTSRGARRADGTRVHLLGVAEHGGHLLDHLEVDVKHNETSHFTALLEPLALDGTVVTSDALHTVRANLNWLVKNKKAHYIAVVKKNQPLLHARIKALPWRQVPGGSTAREAGHGRIETRTLKAAHVSRLDFPHARQAIKITRWRKDTATGKTSRETVYAVTSLTSAHATARDLARLVREHWSIEAHHHVRSPRRDFQRRCLDQPHRQRPCQPGHHPSRHHRGHQRRRLPARPRRPTRPQHSRRNPPTPRPRLGQERTFTEHAGALLSTSRARHFYRRSSRDPRPSRRIGIPVTLISADSRGSACRLIKARAKYDRLDRRHQSTRSSHLPQASRIRPYLRSLRPSNLSACG